MHSVIFSYSFECLLECAYEVLNIQDYFILVSKSVIHFLLNICTCLIELISRSSLVVLDPFIFSLNLNSNFLIQYRLLFKSFLLLSGNCLLYLLTFFMQHFQYLPFLLHSCISFCIYCILNICEVLPYWL